MKVNFMNDQTNFEEEDKQFSHGNQFDNIGDTPSSSGGKGAEIDSLTDLVSNMNVNAQKQPEKFRGVQFKQENSEIDIDNEQIQI